MIQIDDNNFLSFQNTFWNDQVLGFNSNEITRFEYNDIRKAEKMLDQFELICIDNRVKFTSFRFDSNSLETKFIIDKKKYYYAESSYCLVKKLINIEKLTAKTPRLKINIESSLLKDLSNDDLREIFNIAGSTFNHGRFAEDYNFGKKVSDERNKNWINNEVVGSNEIFLLRNNNVIVGFMMFAILGSEVTLLLGGISENYRLYAYNFWYKIIENLHYRKFENIKVIISAANISTVNIYSHFEFKFTKLLIGYHKYRTTI
jgi:hypothetical protein